MSVCFSTLMAKKHGNISMIWSLSVKVGELVIYTDDWGTEWLCTVLYYEGVFTKVFVMAIPDQWFVYTTKLRPVNRAELIGGKHEEEDR
jgi:hypothetical protein